MRRIWIALAAILLIALTIWFWRAGSSASKPRGTGATQVVSAVVAQADVSVRLTASGTVSALQTVEVRPQISATIKAVHIKEGQFVRKGDRIFSLDARTEDANLSRNTAQVVKDRADLMNAERNLERQRELFTQEYVSRAELEAAQNQVAVLRGQLEVDSASVDASRVARSFGEITAPIAGRTGAIAIYPGSLVQPNGAALVSITQIDPINVNFTLPERELAALQQSLARGEVPVFAKLDLADQPALKGRLVFIDNAVDTASGTIRLKAQFPNADNRLWPGMFVTVTLAPRALAGAVTVPVQAVQTGPEKKFLYVIGEDHKVTAQPVHVRLIQDGIAVIEGVAPGARVVVEGAQNLRPGSVVESEDRQGKGGAETNSAGRQ
ncbi:MAG: efflux RND transporter periplasmic adaptor subunit [Gallionella sp.]|nr:efflux RND transporter periplasmic adaptor subunit [Gallionella sp.]